VSQRKVSKEERNLLKITAELGQQEIVITRIYNAPRELVYLAYTDPHRIPEW